MENSSITSKEISRQQRDTFNNDANNFPSCPPKYFTGGKMGSFSLQLSGRKPMDLSVSKTLDTGMHKVRLKQSRPHGSSTPVERRSTLEQGTNPFSLLCPYCRSRCTRRDACKSEWEAHETMIQRQKQAMEESKKVAFIRDSEYPILANTKNEKDEVPKENKLSYADILKIKAQAENVKEDLAEDFKPTKSKPVLIPFLQINPNSQSHKKIDDLETRITNDDKEDVHPALKCSYMGRFAAGADRAIHETFKLEGKDMSTIRKPDSTDAKNTGLQK